jgi:hypothetical protein
MRWEPAAAGQWGRWGAVVGYAVVAFGVAAVLLDRSGRNGGAAHSDFTAIGDIAPPRSERAAVEHATTTQPKAPWSAKARVWQETSAAPPELTRCDVTQRLEHEVALLLAPGPNGSDVFSKLDGSGQHMELAQQILGNARARMTTEPSAESGCLFMAGLTGSGPCAAQHRTPGRVIVFGGSMTYGTEPMKHVRRSCPGCPHASTMTTAKGRIYGDAPHCCSWPRFVDRWFAAAASKGVLKTRPDVVNLAVPASSSAWLAPQVLHILSSLPGGPATACDVVVLDYSVNDADAKVLYHDNETELAHVLATVVAKVAPAPVIVVQM